MYGVCCEVKGSLGLGLLRSEEFMGVLGAKLGMACSDAWRGVKLEGRGYKRVMYPSDKVRRERGEVGFFWSRKSPARDDTSYTK